MTQEGGDGDGPLVVLIVVASVLAGLAALAFAFYKLRRARRTATSSKASLDVARVNVQVEEEGGRVAQGAGVAAPSMYRRVREYRRAYAMAT